MALETHFEEDEIIGTVESHDQKTGDSEIINSKENLIGSTHHLPTKDQLIETLETLHMDSLKAVTEEERAEIAEKMEVLSKKLEEMGEEKMAA